MQDTLISLIFEINSPPPKKKYEKANTSWSGHGKKILKQKEIFEKTIFLAYNPPSHP